MLGTVPDGSVRIAALICILSFATLVGVGFVAQNTGILPHSPADIEAYPSSIILLPLACLAAGLCSVLGLLHVIRKARRLVGAEVAS